MSSKDVKSLEDDPVFASFTPEQKRYFAARLEEEKRETEQERHKAEQERRKREEAEARERQERQAKEALQEDMQDTTLEEYLQTCHEYVLSNIVLNTNGYLTTRSVTTNPKGKHCPRRLRPWGDNFFETQKAMLRRLKRALPPDTRLFENKNALRVIGRRIATMPVRREADLCDIEKNCVGQPVQIILNGIQKYTAEHNLGEHATVYFQTNANDLRADDNELVSTPIPSAVAGVQRDNKLLTDQICAYRLLGGAPEIAYVVEFKAPHKLHTSHCEQGLRPMDIVHEVASKPIVPTQDPARFQHYAELFVAAAVTQTYHYMLEAGLEYGYVTNGDAIVFLKIDWARSSELLYHLALPAREVEANDDPVYANTVAQVLAFTLLALDSPQHSDDERNAAVQASETWAVDFNSMMEQMSRIEDQAAQEKEAADGPNTPPRSKHRRVPSSPAYEPKPVKRVKRRPEEGEEEEGEEKVAHRPITRSYTRCGGQEEERTRRPEEDDEGDGGSSSGGANPEGRARLTRVQNQGSSSSSTSAPASSTQEGKNTHSRSSGETQRLPSQIDSQIDSQDKTDSGGRSLTPRPYCTPTCLLSLMQGGSLDPRCPNVHLHGKGKKHPVSFTKWMALLQQQLSQSVVQGFVNLQKHGGCGVLFQITLLEYGYSFVAKGTTESRISSLHKEEAVYQRLEPLQGRHVPVCLGTVDMRPLKMTVFYSLGVRIVYFLLLSYGGTRLEDASTSSPSSERAVIGNVVEILRRMHALGVVHGDVRLPNVLQSPNGDEGQLTLVDFDKASILPWSASGGSSSRPLLAVSPNKRRRLLEDDEDAGPRPKGNATTPDQSREAILHRFHAREDLANANTLFSLDCGRPIRLWDA